MHRMWTYSKNPVLQGATDQTKPVRTRESVLATAAELKNELEEGLVVTADDFNPLKLVRERK